MKVILLVAVAALLLSSVSIAGCGGDGKVKVDMKDFQYFPKDIAIKQGQTIVWKNVDIEAHSITAGDWDSGTIEPGKSYSRKFDVPGTYEFHCVFHPDMVGKVTVTARSSGY